MRVAIFGQRKRLKGKRKRCSVVTRLAKVLSGQVGEEQGLRNKGLIERL